MLMPEAAVSSSLTTSKRTCRSRFCFSQPASSAASFVDEKLSGRQPAAMALRLNCVSVGSKALPARLSTISSRSSSTGRTISSQASVRRPSNTRMIALTPDFGSQCVLSMRDRNWCVNTSGALS